jgi:hypothetical protein
LPDLFYLVAAPTRTAATWGLAGAPLLNVALALFLIAASRRARATASVLS